MTPRGALRRRLWCRRLTVLLILALAWSPAVRVIAGDRPPPSPTGRAQLLTLAPAQPAAGQAVLYDQTDAASPYWISSQDSTDSQYDTRAADDFYVTPTSNSWHITAVEVAGLFYSGSGDHSVNSVSVEFYADSAGLPGYRLYAANVLPISGTASSGAFYLPLSPTVELASNASYWVSVQAIQSSLWYWAWSERTTQTLGSSVWQNPSSVFATGCTGWTAINVCFPGTGPDLLFRLYGTQSANEVTPILLSLDPNYAFNRAFTLNANGAGFADGAVLNWTLGTTKHFSTTVSSAARLSALISAADVSSYGTVTVSVTNPGPCSHSCTSNELLFAVKGLLFLPLVRR